MVEPTTVAKVPLALWPPPGIDGQSIVMIKLIVEMKEKNLRYGCLRIALLVGNNLDRYHTPIAAQFGM